MGGDYWSILIFFFVVMWGDWEVEFVGILFFEREEVKRLKNVLFDWLMMML